MTVAFIFWIIAAFFIGAVFHEADLSRQFNKHGDASAWFFDIKK